jgi:S1-C subfamily serine protease
MASPSRLRFFALILFVSVLVLSSGRSPAQVEGDKQDNTFKKALRSTVWIVVRASGADADGKVSVNTGTGCLIDVRKKLVLTNYHVVRDFERFVVYFPIIQNGKVALDRSLYKDLVLRKGGGIPGKTIAKVPKQDIALIQLETVPAGAQPLKLVADSVGVDETVHSIGNPGDSPQMWVYTHRKVIKNELKKFQSRSVDGKHKMEVEARMIETDSSGRPGESGGPLVNEKGELVGVTQGGRSDGTNGLFVDISHVKELLESKGFLAKSTARAAGTGDPKSGGTVQKQASATLEDGDKKEDEAASKLRLAKRLAADGLNERARERYQDIVKKYPDTKAAKEAKELLEMNP